MFLLRELVGVHRRSRRGAEGQGALASLVQGDIGLFINVWATLPDLRWAVAVAVSLWRWRCRFGVSRGTWLVSDTAVTYARSSLLCWAAVRHSAARVLIGGRYLLAGQGQE